MSYRLKELQSFYENNKTDELKIKNKIKDAILEHKKIDELNKQLNDKINDNNLYLILNKTNDKILATTNPYEAVLKMIFNDEKKAVVFTKEIEKNNKITYKYYIKELYKDAIKQIGYDKPIDLYVVKNNSFKKTDYLDYYYTKDKNIRYIEHIEVLPRDFLHDLIDNNKLIYKIIISNKEKDEVKDMNKWEIFEYHIGYKNLNTGILEFKKMIAKKYNY